MSVDGQSPEFDHSTAAYRAFAASIFPDGNPRGMDDFDVRAVYEPLPQARLENGQIVVSVPVEASSADTPAPIEEIEPLFGLEEVAAWEALRNTPSVKRRLEKRDHEKRLAKHKREAKLKAEIPTKQVKVGTYFDYYAWIERNIVKVVPKTLAERAEPYAKNAGMRTTPKDKEAAEAKLRRDSREHKDNRPRPR